MKNLTYSNLCFAIVVSHERLRCHVVQRATIGGHRDRRALGDHVRGDVEIDELDLAADHNKIARLDVRVDDAHGVNCMQRL